MTAILKLVQRDDFLSDVDSLDLLNFAAGWELEDNGWQQGVAAEGDSSVIETLTLLARGTTHDNLAAAVQALDLKLQQIARYANNDAEQYGVWLRCKMVNETGTRQALVRSARRSPVPMWSGVVNIASGGYYYAQTYTLALERTPYWEADSHVVYGAAPGVNCVGGTYDHTTYGGSPGALHGDVAARVALATLAGYAGGGGPLTKFWCGFRTNRMGNRANFQATWSLRKAGGFGSDTTGGTTNADATAKDGYKVITTFAVPTMARRAKIRVSDVTANTTDQRGSFLVLLRAKLNAAGTVDVRLADGLYSAPAMAVRDRVSVSGTSWQLYELGTVQIPSPGRQIAGVWAIDSYALAVDAERITGTPQLHLDCLVMIPVTEGWFSVDMGNPAGITGGEGVQTGTLLYLVDRPEGQKYSTYVDTGLPLSVGAPRVADGMPAGNGIFVLAGQRVASSVLADAVNVTFQVYPRWETLRGAA